LRNYKDSVGLNTGSKNSGPTSCLHRASADEIVYRIKIQQIWSKQVKEIIT
jgi:hypothetical protein